MPLPALLESQKTEILDNWEAIVSSLAGARHLSQPALRNHMPQFFDWLIERIRTAGRGGAFPHEQSIEHATERVSAGYDLSEVISEYTVLRDCVLEAWERAPEAHVTPREVRVFNQALDDAIAFTAVFYARLRLFRDREDGFAGSDADLVAPH